MKKTLLLLTFSLIFLSALRSQPHQNAQMQFVGVWTLRSCTATGKDGKATFPYGQHPSGQIQYDPSGNMMVLIVNRSVTGYSLYDAVAHAGGVVGISTSELLNACCISCQNALLPTSRLPPKNVSPLSCTSA